MNSWGQKLVFSNWDEMVSSGSVLFWSFTDLDFLDCKLYIHCLAHIHSFHLFIEAFIECLLLSRLASNYSLKGDSFGTHLKTQASYLIFLSAVQMHQISRLLGRALETGSSLLPFPLLRICREPPKNQGPEEMLPVMLHISSPTVTIYAWDGVAVPTFAYPHGASSCPLVSAFVSRKSLAVNITASQVIE